MSVGEAERLAFLLRRDGPSAAAAFAAATMRVYRRVVVERKAATLYRRRLIESYCAFKRFAIGVARGRAPDALIREEAGR